MCPLGDIKLDWSGLELSVSILASIAMILIYVSEKVNEKC